MKLQDIEIERANKELLTQLVSNPLGRNKQYSINTLSTTVPLVTAFVISTQEIRVILRTSELDKQD